MPSTDAAEPANPSPKVALVDDIAVVRQGFGVVHEGLDVVATYASAEEFLQDQPHADVVVLDLRLNLSRSDHAMQGTDAVRAVAGAGYPVCIYTEETRPLVLATCLRAGAHGIVHKADSPSQAEAAIAAVAAGQTVITQSLVSVTEILSRRGKLPELTEKQRLVLHGRARGMRWSDIARTHFISEATARDHMDAVNRKAADFFQQATPAQLEQELGVGPGDLVR